MKIYVTSVVVADLEAEHDRLQRLGVDFTQPPIEAGPVKMAVLDNTCGNLIQLVEMTGKVEIERGPAGAAQESSGTATANVSPATECASTAPIRAGCNR